MQEIKNALKIGFSLYTKAALTQHFLNQFLAPTLKTCENFNNQKITFTCSLYNTQQSLRGHLVVVYICFFADCHSFFLIQTKQ